MLPTETTRLLQATHNLIKCHMQTVRHPLCLVILHRCESLMRPTPAVLIYLFRLATAHDEVRARCPQVLPQVRHSINHKLCPVRACCADTTAGLIVLSGVKAVHLCMEQALLDATWKGATSIGA